MRHYSAKPIVRCLAVCCFLSLLFQLNPQANAQTIEVTPPPPPPPVTQPEQAAQPNAPQVGTIQWGSTSIIASEKRFSVWLQVKFLGNTTLNSFSYRTIEGSAGAGTDFTARDITVSVPANQAYTYIQIPLVNSALVESKETFVVQLYGLTGFTLQGSANATVDIYERLYAMPQVRGVSTRCDTAEDQNDNPLTAGFLGGALNNGSVCSSNFLNEVQGDSDYYRIYVDGSPVYEYLFNITMTNTTNPAAHNMDIFLYELVNGNYQTITNSLQPGQEPDTIAVSLKQGTTYFLRVLWGSSSASSAKPSYNIYTSISSPLNP